MYVCMYVCMYVKRILQSHMLYNLMACMRAMHVRVCEYICQAHNILQYIYIYMYIYIYIYIYTVMNFNVCMRNNNMM